jgi:hypothetical protein
VVSSPVHDASIQDFFSAASAFGTIELDNRLLRVQLLEGTLPLEKVVLTDGGQTRTLE